MNRHRAYWSAMGSSLHCDQIERNISQRNEWHQKVLNMWVESKVSFECAMSAEWVEKALSLIPENASFHWTAEGLEDVYLNALNLLKKFNPMSGE